jgi:hypothetical protein
VQIDIAFMAMTCTYVAAVTVPALAALNFFLISSSQMVVPESPLNAFVTVEIVLLSHI